MGIRNSWLDVVKKAFGSPTKPPTWIRSDHHHHEEDQGSDQVQKSRVKQQQQRRWSFKKQAAASITTIQIQILHHDESNNPLISSTCTTKTHDDDATTTALAPSYTHEEIHKQAAAAAALVIQASFRGYLARRALEALKGVVKLQALIRGENVRKMTLLKCMHSLLRLQAHFSDQRIINYNAYTIIDQEADNTQAAACLFQVASKKDLPNAPSRSSFFIHQQFCGSNENQHLEQQDYWDQKDTTCSCFSPCSYQRRPHNQTSYYQHQQPRFDYSNPPFSSPLLLHKSRIQLSSTCSSSPRQAERNLSAGGVNGTRKPRRYMCATASAMARQRILSTTEGDKKPSAARKGLSFKHKYILYSEVDLRSPQRRLSMSSSSSSSCCCKQTSEDEIDLCQIDGDERDIRYVGGRFR